jgi:hypothetical protein
MDMKPRCAAGFAAMVLCTGVGSAFAQQQPDPANAASTAAPATAAALPTAVQPAAAQPAATAPGYPPPAAYYPPPYYPPPGYAPPPGYYPPPGYPPAYYPQQELGPPPGSHIHDGFYMRLTTGLGVLSAKYKRSELDTTISGPGVAATFAFGGAVATNLVLYGEMLMTMALNPKSESGGTTQNLTNKNVNLFGIGPGVAYYLEPSNLYFSGTLAFSYVSETDSSNSNNSNSSVDLTEMGIGLSFMVGKEWWVSHNWGLGAAGLLHVASMKTKDQIAGTTPNNMTATALSVLFSATYN